MASLVEELLSVLDEEASKYDELYSLGTDKRESIIHRDLEKLEKTAGLENGISGDLQNLEKKRVRVLKDMSVVLGRDDETLTVTQVIMMLDKQPKEQEALTEARDRLIRAASNMQFMNQQNAILLSQAIEMVEFDLTLFKSMRQAPETANYGRDALGTGDILPRGGFDAKQ